MKFRVRKILFILAILMMVPAVQAADGTVTFQGKVSASACVIENPDLLVEGFKNRSRWPVAEARIYFSGPFGSIINIDCGDLDSIPKIRFTPETGTVVGEKGTYLKTTGTASNVAMQLGDSSWRTGNLDLNGKLYDLSPVDAANGKYRFAVAHYVVGLAPYDESFNGDFEAVLGYDLIYN